MRSTAARLVLLGLVIGALLVAVLAVRDHPEAYVVTAIDYHFHDAHPTRPLVPGQELVVENQGTNVHNVTIPALGFSRDVDPGERITIDDIAGRLGPGRYVLRCSIHAAAFGMVGTIAIADH